MGLRTQVSGIVQQFGLATMPSLSSARGPFTSGTTSGIPSARRKAADLSTTCAPPLTAYGTSSREFDVPTEKSATSKPPFSSAPGVASSIVRPACCFPAERAEANSVMSSWPRCSSSATTSVPTAPVEPITAILGLAKVERLVERLDSAFDIVGLDMAGDLDRRRRDDGRLDAEARERLERPRSDARVALHAGSDEADLAEVVTCAPLEAERVERRGGVGAVLRRRREDDLGSGLDDRVDV